MKQSFPAESWGQYFRMGIMVLKLWDQVSIFRLNVLINLFVSIVLVDVYLSREIGGVVVYIVEI